MKKIILNVFKYLTVSGLSLQFLLGNNIFSFISVGVLCEFGIVKDMYIMLSPQEEESHSFFLNA